MVGEHYFATTQWQKAMDAYRHVPDDAATSDLATFKIAWCEWKLGDTDAGREGLQARARQGGRGRAHRHRGAAAGAAPRSRDEALEYLVVVFTEDRSISPQGGLRLPRVDRRRAVLARRHDQGRRELRRRRPSGSAATRRSGSSSRWIRSRSRPPSTSATSSQNWNERARRRARAGRDQGPARQLRADDGVGEGAEEPRGARPLARRRPRSSCASPRRTSTARRSAARSC